MKHPETWGIDGDIVVYSVGFAAENDPLAYALRSVKTMLTTIMDDCGAREGIVYLTGDSNYRMDYGDDEYPYKGNRKDAKKPRHLAGIREYMIETLGAVVADGEEADDLLGIGAVQHGHGIATLDKDLNGVHGWHYNWKKGEVYMVSPEEADLFFYRQMLTGDSTDNIPGLFKRVGVKATQKIMAPLDEMQTASEMFEYVRSVYLDGYDKVGMCPDDRDDVVDQWLLKQARCLWIRRDYNEMWEVPSEYQSTED